MLLLLLAQGLICPLWAGGRWRETGIKGGAIESVTYDPANPAVVYAATGSGLFKSVDNGHNWRPIEQEILLRRTSSGTPVLLRWDDLVVDPVDSNTLYAVSFSSLARSRDGGNSWVDLPRPPGFFSGGTVTVSPHDNELVFAALTNGVARSSDQGDSWESLDNGPDRNVRQVLVDPVLPNRIFALSSFNVVGSSSRGVFRSEDQGDTWAQLYDSDQLHTALVQNPDDNQVLWLSLCGDVGETLLLKSANGGEDWNPSDVGLPKGSDVPVSCIAQIVVSPVDPRLMWVQYTEDTPVNQWFSSSNGGVNWTPFDPGQEMPLRFLDPHPTNSQQLLGGFGSSFASFRQLRHSSDLGANWNPIGYGLLASRPGPVFDPVNPANAYAAAGDGGVWRSRDGGMLWSFSGLLDERIRSVSIDPNNTSRLYALNSNNKVFRSSDRGETWQTITPPVESGFGIVDNFVLGVDPSQTGRIYVVSEIIRHGPATRSVRVFGSSNGGGSWSNGIVNWVGTPGFFLPAGMLVDPDNPSRLYLADSQQGVALSDDVGSTFTLVEGGGLPAAAACGMEMDPRDSQTLYAFLCPEPFQDPLFENATYRTTDGAASWSEFKIEGQKVVKLVFDPFRPEIQYARVGEELLRTRDDGANWFPIDGASFPRAFDRHNPMNVLGTGLGGITQYAAPVWLYGAGDPEGRGGQFDGLAITNLAADRVLTDLRSQTEPAAPAGAQRPAGGQAAALELGPAQQAARLRSQILPGDATKTAWVEQRSDGLTGSFFQFGQLDLAQLDGGVAIESTDRRLILSRLFSGDGVFYGQRATTRISLFNPYSEAVDVCLYQIAGQALLGSACRTIDATQLLEDRASALFPRAGEGGFVVAEVTAGAGIVGLQRIQLEGVDTVFGLNAAPYQPGRDLYSAQFASAPGLFANLNLINGGPVTRQVTISGVDSSGASLGPDLEITLGPAQQWSRDAGEIFAGNFVGSLIVQADGEGVLGDVIFGDPEDGSFAAALPLQAEMFSEAVFNQVANLEGFFTGLAFFDPRVGTSPAGEEPTQITIEVFRPDGSSAGSSVRNLLPGQRISELVSQLVPSSAGQQGGYTKVTATNPIIGQMIFGATTPEGAIRLFSAVTPTRVK